MKFEKLENIAKVISGGTPLTSKREYYDNGTIPWVKTGDLKVMNLYEANDKITQSGLENSSAKILPVNTVLIAMYGATIGACSILKIEAATNQACAAVIPNGNVYYEYLYFFLRSIKQTLIKKGVGGGQPNISTTILKEIKVFLPEYEGQLQIATILSKAEILIAQRKESIRLLDEYLKSTFLEMFGDPVKNNKKLTTIRLRELGNWKSGGTPLRSRSDFFTGDIPWITSGELNELFISDAKEKITQEAVKKSNAKLIEKGSLLIGMYDTAALKSSINFNIVTCNQAIAYAKLDDKICNTLFVYFNIQIGKEFYKSQQRGVRQQNMNISMVKGLEILYPSIKLQDEFGGIVEKVQDLKKKSQESLQGVENLFSSLSQQAFDGKLNLIKIKELAATVYQVEDWFKERVEKIKQVETLRSTVKNVSATIEQPELSIKKGTQKKTSVWATAKPFSKAKGIVFDNIEGEAILQKVFSKKVHGFSFKEFEEFLKKEKFEYTFKEVKSFVFNAIESNQLYQVYDTKKWMSIKQKADDALNGEPSINLVYNKTSK